MHRDILTAPIPPASQAKYPSEMVQRSGAGMGNVLLRVPVGAFLQGVQVTQADRELEEHLVDCGVLAERAMTRFQAFGNPHDRDEAVQWQHWMQEAIGQRRPEIKQAMDAEIQCRIGGLK